MPAFDRDQSCWDHAFMTRRRRYGGIPPLLPQLPGGSLVLEVGCGDGKTLRAMEGCGWDIIALDFSRYALNQCMHTPSLGKIGFVLSEAALLPFRDTTFDALFLSHVVSHIKASQRTLMAKEAARVLKQGGSVFFRDFSIDDMRAGKGLRVEPDTCLRGDGITTHYFTLTETAALFSILIPVDMAVQKWAIRIKGEQLIRAEIYAQFQKG